MSRSSKDAKGGHRKPSSWDGRRPVKMRTYGRRPIGFIQDYRGDGERRSEMRGRARHEARRQISALVAE